MRLNSIKVITSASVQLLSVRRVVILLSIWGWQVFKDNQNVTASIEFNKALVPTKRTNIPKRLPLLKKFKPIGGRVMRVLAHLYQANIYLATNDLDKALNSGQRAVTATKPNTMFRQLALVTLAAAEERKNQCKSAIEHFNEAQKIRRTLTKRAILGKARCAEQIGDKAASDRCLQGLCERKSRFANGAQAY